jgi:hypothetical protein
MKLRYLATALGASAAVPLAASAATAQSAPAAAPAEQTTEVEPSAASHGPEIAPRPWLYLDDPSLPAPMHAVVASRATYTKDASPTRPFGANLARPGGVVEVGGEVGLLKQLSLTASGFGGGEQLGVGGIAGLRFAPFEGVWRSTHAVLSGGWLHELNGGDGGWMRLSVAQDIQRLRLGVTGHGEHIFQRGRDAVDLLFMAGASYAVAGPVRAGVEYVAQDLEGAIGGDVEQGVRHFVGPTVGVDVLDKRLSVVAGPAFGLGPQSPPFSGRFALAYEY